MVIHLIGGAISDNILGISEVPSEARNLDGALAKLDMLLLADPTVARARHEVPKSSA